MVEAIPELVRCNSCGFLGKHANQKNAVSPKFYEMDKLERQEGAAFEHIPIPGHGRVHTVAICFRHVHQTQSELSAFDDP